MVKFKKLLAEKTTENNSKYTYINYKKLKGIINETYIKLRITKGKIININPDKTLFSKFLSFFTIKRLSEGEYSSKINDIKEFTKSPLVKDFFIELNKEINSLYKFYSREEISLSNELNQLFLNKRLDVSSENLTTIDDDSQKLYMLALRLKLLYECLILNFEAIRKICKKFDKKLATFLNNNSFCIYYIKALIDYHNSDLSYLLKMQIIEQGLILIQNKVRYIKQKKHSLIKDPQKKNKLSNMEYGGELTEEDLINEIDSHLEKTNDIVEGMLSNEKYSTSNINLGLIFKYDDNKDVNNNNYKDGERLSIRNEYAIDYDNEHINAFLKKEESLSIARMFVNKDVYQRIINIFFYYLNDLNYQNIVLLFFHLFFDYMIIGVSYIQIIFVLFFTEQKEIKFYGIFTALIFFSQLLTSRILSISKVSLIKFNYWITISSILVILLQLSYLYLIKCIEEKELSNISSWIWSVLYSLMVGSCTSTKLSNKYLISCIPKNTLLLMYKNLSLFRGIFLYSGILLFYLFNKYFCYIIIFLFSLISILFLALFTEKNSENFYKYKTNFNELSEKIKIFNNNGEIIEKSQLFNYNNDDIINNDVEVRESVLLEDLKEEQKIQLEKANKEFNELNQKSNFNVSNLVPEKTKLIIKSLTDATKSKRTKFIFSFQFLSTFYKHIVLLISIINYIKKVNLNTDNERTNLFNIRTYDVIVVISLPLGYLLYKSFNRYNDIHSIFRFYFIINCVLLFIFSFQYDSNYILLNCVIFTSFNYVMDSKINLFFAVNYRNETSFFKMKTNSLVNLAYYLGKIASSICFYFFIDNEFYVLSSGTLIYFIASFYDKYISLSTIIILGRAYSKELN